MGSAGHRIRRGAPWQGVSCTKHMKNALFIILVIVANQSIATEPSAPNTKARCIEAGGNWVALGLTSPDKPKVCDLKTSDAGNTCNDSSDCEGSCFAQNESKPGTISTGVCSTYRLVFGNLKLVEKGTVVEINAE